MTRVLVILLCAFFEVSAFPPGQRRVSDKLHVMGNTFWDIVEEASAIPGAARVSETSTCHSKLIFITRLFNIMRLRGENRASAESDLSGKRLEPIRFVPVGGLELYLPVRPALRTAPNEDLELL